MVNFAPVALPWPLSLSAHPVPGERGAFIVYNLMLMYLHTYTVSIYSYIHIFIEYIYVNNIYVELHAHAVPPHQKHLFHNNGDDYEPHSQKTKGLGQAALNCALDISSSLFRNASCVKGKRLEKMRKQLSTLQAPTFKNMAVLCSPKRKAFYVPLMLLRFILSIHLPGPSKYLGFSI